jgi:hypothetical protein
VEQLKRSIDEQGLQRQRKRLEEARAKAGAGGGPDQVVQVSDGAAEADLSEGWPHSFNSWSTSSPSQTL